MKPRAILILGLFTFLSNSGIHTQTFIPVYWETLNGELDSAYILRNWRPVRKIATRPLYAKFLEQDGELRSDVYVSDMKWLRSGKSMLLRRIEKNGQELYFQLLYEGGVSLYEEVESGDYYLECEEELHLLDKSAPRKTVLELFLGSCIARGIPPRIGSREAALALARKVNDCLSTPGYRWFRGQFSRRFKIGIGHDWITDEINRAFAPAGSNSSWGNYALEPPTGSLTFNYTPWPASSWFTTDLQVRPLHFDRQASINSVDFPSVRNESFEVTNLYLYPGVHLQGSTSLIQPYFGLGAAIVLPLRFRYHLEFENPQFTQPGFPIQEELLHGQNLQVGAYVTWGVNVRIMNRMLVGVGIRAEWLYQDWQQFEQVGTHDRHLLPYTQKLAPYDWRLIQLQIAYAWK
ncbi:MAG: hypothetical protein AAFO03_06860 [Bacteroidota bacterium]